MVWYEGCWDHWVISLEYFLAARWIIHVKIKTWWFTKTATLLWSISHVARLDYSPSKSTNPSLLPHVKIKTWCFTKTTTTAAPLWSIFHVGLVDYPSSKGARRCQAEFLHIKERAACITWARVPTKLQSQAIANSSSSTSIPALVTPVKESVPSPRCPFPHLPSLYQS